MIDTDITNQITNAHSVGEWFSIVWKVGIFLAIGFYIKTIVRSIFYVIKEIWGVFIGDDGKLNSKELMGILSFIVVTGCAIKYFTEDKYDLTFLLTWMGFYCTMFGIEGVHKIITSIKSK